MDFYCLGFECFLKKCYSLFRINVVVYCYVFYSFCIYRNWIFLKVYFINGYCQYIL